MAREIGRTFQHMLRQEPRLKLLVMPKNISSSESLRKEKRKKEHLWHDLVIVLSF
ncbi:hypothetical protein JHK82_034881 [Glycine max]|uniref:Uncharacterized protein n=2 Tax=Glycine subgen. Soja TaxID=1462606 RepID=A0A0R0GH34_SOYBN|nr:hypothetical protein JHK87_034930 [Glycine soja]KAG4969168.1 hypothetical protein JHK85_035589 [Glycine max]KAG4975616.1 hypothetical protein JHK86_035090 [Glycine max]KAG5111612.1 hypothetical protein JHK82_034881 [Glycine max]KAG5128995.1 hypothetical protein JHK84_035392 [Glycine max]